MLKLFLETNILTSELAHPQKMDEYIVHVLVPETGVRLIAEDRSILSLVEARKVMQDSVEFGNYMQDIHDVSQNI